jgi:hypothetical protein
MAAVQLQIHVSHPFRQVRGRVRFGDAQSGRGASA